MSGASVRGDCSGEIEAGRAADRIFRALAAYVIGMSVVQVSAIGLSAAGVRITQPVALATLFAALAGFWAWMLGAERASGGSRFTGADTAAASVVDRLTTAGFVFVPAVYAFVAVAAYVVPEMCGDGFTYHIPTIHFWAQHGHICWIESWLTNSSCMNGYPNAVETLSYVMVMAFNDSRLLQSATLMFLPLGVLGIGAIASCLGARPGLAILSGLLYLLAPINITQSMSTYVDASFCAAAIALIAMSARAQKAAENKSIYWRTAVPLGAAMGLAIGAKASGLAHAALAMAVLVYLLLRRHTVAGTPLLTRARRAVAPVILTLSAAFLVGGFWYARNWAVTGSPVYPAGVRVGDLVVFDGPPVSEVIHVDSNTPEFMRSWPAPKRIAYTWLQGLTQWPGSIFWLDSRTGGIGWLWITGCVPAIIYAARRAFRQARGVRSTHHLILVGTFVGIVFLATPMNWWSRYTLWIYALGLPCFALALSDIRRDGRLLGWKHAWAIACVAVSFVEAGYLVRQIRPNVFVIERTKTLPGISVQIRTWQTWESGLAIEDGHVRHLLASGDAVAVGPLGNRTAHLLGHLCQPIGRRFVAALPANVERKDVENLRSRNVRHAFWDTALCVPEALASATREVTRVEVSLPGEDSVRSEGGEASGFVLLEMMGTPRTDRPGLDGPDAGGR